MMYDTDEHIRIAIRDYIVPKYIFVWGQFYFQRD